MGTLDSSATGKTIIHFEGENVLFREYDTYYDANYGSRHRVPQDETPIKCIFESVEDSDNIFNYPGRQENVDVLAYIDSEIEIKPKDIIVRNPNTTGEIEFRVANTNKYSAYTELELEKIPEGEEP